MYKAHLRLCGDECLPVGDHLNEHLEGGVEDERAAVRDVT